MIEEGSFTNLYQHGFQPFGADWIGAQSLVRVLDNWKVVGSERNQGNF